MACDAGASAVFPPRDCVARLLHLIGKGSIMEISCFRTAFHRCKRLFVYGQAIISRGL
jgi:hypothetical protein